MDFIYNIIGTPLGWILWLCYQITHNYGISLLIFTVITRSAMLPLSFKQQKASVKMQLMQPKIKEIQTKYASNRQKMTEEMNMLYQKEGHNPASGCLPMAIPLLIMFGLIDVIYRPMKHILHLPQDIIQTIQEIALSLELVPSIKGLNPAQIKAVQSMRENVAPWLDGGVPQDIIQQINTLNLDFFGINLGLTPSGNMFKEIFTQGVFNPLLLIPLLSGITAMIVSLVSIKTTAASMQNAGAAGSSMKGMMLVMPIFSFMIALSVPAGVGLYWTYSNLFAIGQSLLMYKFYNPKEMAEKAKQAYEEQQERERQERIEAKKQAKLKIKNGEAQEAALSQKEINRRKLAAARKRDAEKYGETYVEVKDNEI